MAGEGGAFHGDGFSIGIPHPDEAGDADVRSETERHGFLRSWPAKLSLHPSGGGRESAGAHVITEAGQAGEGLFDALGGEGTQAAFPYDVTVSFEQAEGAADRDAGNPEFLRQLALRGKRGVFAPFAALEGVTQEVADLNVLRGTELGIRFAAGHVVAPSGALG